MDEQMNTSINMQGLHYDLDSLFPENPDFLDEEEIRLKDYENMKRLYPVLGRRLLTYVSEYMDQYEYEGSPIYHEYPDDVTVYGIAKDIYYYFSDDEPVTENNGTDDAFDRSENDMNYMDCDDLIFDMIRIIVCNEMYIRRRRHDSFCNYYGFNK